MFRIAVCDIMFCGGYFVTWAVWCGWSPACRSPPPARTVSTPRATSAHHALGFLRSRNKRVMDCTMYIAVDFTMIWFGFTYSEIVTCLLILVIFWYKSSWLPMLETTWGYVADFLYFGKVHLLFLLNPFSTHFLDFLQKYLPASRRDKKFCLALRLSWWNKNPSKV